ncbi:lipase, putative [Candida dubliniensis CD36]|uniref:Lipase, putative n=1 Tax=Candida dubliniensis (strain CD36 / ATCC MYA-646 / CBS 7987 / NCPF 3949 / NRRL Y-17841) TaxID=573826 RepID=B9WFG3_CANDC|nr:lipase, putative [Candida dubliniensis CD36]CAX41982.1 lipase, putative [Candida dubliniensis CD36]
MIRTLITTTIIPIIAYIINNTPSYIWAIIDFIMDICFFWVKQLYQIYNRKDPLKEYVKQLKTAPNYNDWKEVAYEVDKLTNMDLWRQNFISKHYDYVLIDERLKLLREARLNQDSQVMMSLLRSGLIRNFAGVAQKRLYLKSYMGTKFKIEEYINEVLNCLDYLNEALNNDNNDEYIMNSKQLKLDFFHDARQSFGCSALLLQGGSLFGLCHLGVVKALYFKGLMPRIIGGSAVGAAVASLVCTLTDEELIPILVNIGDLMKNIDLLNHEIDERYGNVIENVVKKGYSQEILLFLKFVRDTIGDLTFEEAYMKTEKILNIVVHPTNQCVPSLLNYITAPNVIIWTAIYASIGTGVLSDDVALYVKDFNNEIVLQTPDVDVKFLKPQDVTYHQQYFKFKPHDNFSGGVGGGGGTSSGGSSSNGVGSGSGNSSSSNGIPGDGEKPTTNIVLQQQSPYTKLTELFNVNHFVISLARPYLAPLISNDLQHYHEYGKIRYDKNTSTAATSTVANNNNNNNDSYGINKRKRTSSGGGAGGGGGSGIEFTKKKDIEKYTQDATSYNLMKKLKTIIGMEIQHRLMVMNKLGLLTDVMKRFFIDEKPPTLQSLASIREVTIVPELRYLMKDFGRVFDVHKTMENIPYWVLVGERSVWPLFPLLWSRCAIEFALDDLYNLHRKRG